MSKARNVVFTLNNYTKNDEELIQAVDCIYLVYGREIAPSTKTPHLQGYIQWKDQPSFSAMKKRLGINSIHLEKAKGNGNQNYEYCTKDGDFFEKGSLKKAKVIQPKLRRCGCPTTEKYPCCALERQYLDEDWDLCVYTRGKYRRREQLDALKNDVAMYNEYLAQKDFEQTLSDVVLGNTNKPKPCLERDDNIDSLTQ